MRARCMYYEERNQRLHRSIRRTIVGCVLTGAVLCATPVIAAEWLAPAADQTVTAAWVSDITTQLNQKSYRDLFMNAVGYQPQTAIVRYLNSAAQALQAGNKPLARSYVDRTLGLFDVGVQRGYFSDVEVEPLKTLIRRKAEMAMKGEQGPPAAHTGDRWTGYTQQGAVRADSGPVENHARAS